MKTLPLFIGALFVLCQSGLCDAADPNPYECGMSPTAVSRLDELTMAQWRQLNIAPAPICSDAVFVRRVYLDVIGTLPTMEEAKSFLESTSPSKRRDLINQLLTRDEYADYWAMKWCDVLRVKAEFPINLWPNAVQAYQRWIRTAIAQNMPYNRFARELLTASGSNFRVGQVNFYRAMQTKTPEGIARTVALTFMGARADHWARDKLDGMSGFFAQLGYKSTAEWKEEIVFFDPTKAVPPTMIYPDGMATKLAPDKDPRQAFADWLISPRNPWFTRNIANRIWAWLLGQGIIEEPDDLRADNPARNSELLAYLERKLISAKYDLKHLIRLVLNSRTYQSSSLAYHPEAEKYFASYPLRRLDAEVLIDAINQITGSTEKYASAIPEPFTFIPEDQRSIALADGSITSPFLELFGRSSRDTGMEKERNNRVTSAQALHLLNSSHIQKKLEQGTKMQALIRGKEPLRDRARSLYLTILSRPPTEQELATITGYASPSSGPAPANPALDVAWALINSPEFLFRH